MSDLCLLAASDAAGTAARDLLAVIATAALAALVMQRLRLAMIPAYLIAGAFVGPNALGLVRSPETLGTISHLAIILLLFGIGLQLHVSILRHGFLRMVLIGVAACTLCVFAGWPIVAAFGLPASRALPISMALALSSTAVVLRRLSDRRELHRVSGRLALAILVVQDMAVLAMLAALPALARWAAAGGDGIVGLETERTVWHQLLLDEVLRVGAAVLILVAGRILLPRFVRESARGRSLEVMMVASVAVALGAAVIADLVGFSLEMGAFLAGFLLARTPFRHQISGQIAPLRDLFIAVFFTTLGMAVDVDILIESWWMILLATCALLALKTLLIGLSCWSFGATTTLSLAVGLFLAQGGEFSLIVLGSAGALGLVDDDVLGICISVVVLSLIVTPSFIHAGNRFALLRWPAWTAPWIARARFRVKAPSAETASQRARRAIVAGFGPVGRRVTQHLEEAGFRCTVVELNPATVRNETEAGRSVVFGSIANADVLDSAGIDHADLLVITMLDEDSAAHAAALARRRNPGLFIAARAGLASHVETLQRSGVDYVLADESAAADAMMRGLAERAALTAAPPDPAGAEHPDARQSAAGRNSEPA